MQAYKIQWPIRVFEMSMTLPRWFGRKSKKKDDKECNKLRENEKHIEITTSSRTNDSTKYLTIQPNYECNKEKRNVKAFSTFKSNVSELYDVERQNTSEVAKQHKEISPRNVTHFHNDHNFSLQNQYYWMNSCESMVFVLLILGD